MEKTYTNKIDQILNALYAGGGRNQAKDLLMFMLDNEDIHPEDVLNNIGQLLTERKQLLERDCILPINRCDYFLEHNKTYTCLDNELKLCVCKKGTPEWNKVSHVLTRFNPQQAYELIHQYENNYE